MAYDEIKIARRRAVQSLSYYETRWARAHDHKIERFANILDDQEDILYLKRIDDWQA